MRHSRPFALLAAGLEELGYHEDGEDDGVYLFTTYRNAHSVVLQDSEHLSIEQQVASLLEQGMDMVALQKATENLLDQEPGGPGPPVPHG